MPRRDSARRAARRGVRPRRLVQGDTGQRRILPGDNELFAQDDDRGGRRSAGVPHWL